MSTHTNRNGDNCYKIEHSNYYQKTGNILEPNNKSGWVSSAFQNPKTINENAIPLDVKLNIRVVGHNDIDTSYFIDWFFKTIPNYTHHSEFEPYSIKTSPTNSVYGYFNIDGNLDGIIRVGVSYDDVHMVAYFFINPNATNPKIGAYLWQYVIERYGNKNLIIYVRANDKPAIKLYKSYGFKFLYKTAITIDEIGECRLMERKG
ncbi:MAG: GNAT family N-acetyltransferase [Oscillospiraceae bacterium]|nr:GNAT family N-acetyltransferase [Oscillospiraceae bacterium]